MIVLKRKKNLFIFLDTHQKVVPRDHEVQKTTKSIKSCALTKEMEFFIEGIVIIYWSTEVEFDQSLLIWHIATLYMHM